MLHLEGVTDVGVVGEVRVVDRTVVVAVATMIGVAGDLTSIEEVEEEALTIIMMVVLAGLMMTSMLVTGTTIDRSSTSHHGHSLMEKR